MDYDLFQSDDDEDILSAFLEATQKQKAQPAELQVQQMLNHDDDDDVNEQVDYDDDADALDLLPEFNCSGRDTIKTQNEFPSNGFVRNGYGLHLRLPRTKLDNLHFDFEPRQLSVCAVIRYLHGETCKNIQKLFAAVAGQQQLQSGAGSGSGCSWYRTRRQVTHFYHLLLHNDNDIDTRDNPAGTWSQWPILCPSVLQLRELLNSCLDADAWRVLYFAEHSKGNECQSPGYHLYHGALEWRLLDLCVQRKFQADAATHSSYHSQLERLMDDLVMCCSHHYRSKHSAELLHTSAFMCRCIKELWLILYQEQETESHEFWTRFHRAMQRHKAQLQLEGNNSSASASTSASTCVSALAYHEFYAWLRLNLARLSAYGRNGEQQTKALPGAVAAPVAAPIPAQILQTGQLLRQFLASQPQEQQRRVYLCLLAPLQLHWGQPDADVLCQLWESLHRSLNCHFSAAGQLEQLPLTCASGAAYVERYRCLLAKPALEDLNLSSFTLFALLLGRTLQLNGGQRGNQSQKLLGRIFSKFSAAKLLALNESGIHHVIELFLCLLLSYGDFPELAPKLREMLLCLALEKLPAARRLLVAKGHMAMLLLHAQRRQPLEDYVGKLLAQLATVRQDADVGAIYANSLEGIFELAEDFSRGEQLLVSPWLTHYLEHSGQAAQERVWQALHLLCERLANASNTGNMSMWEALHQHVLPQLRAQYVTGFSSWLPKLAADFVQLERNNGQCKLLESLLLGPEPANTAASAQLMLHVLPQLQPPSVLLIQVWIKSLVLLTPQHDDVQALTGYVSQLEELRALGLDMAALKDREPLCAFFGALGRRAQREDAVAHLRMQLSHKFHGYVQHFEQWLPAGSARSSSLEQQQATMARFYNFMAIVIYNCAPLAYVRSKPSCFFHLAMTRFLLTTQLQAGAAPEPRLVQLVHKIWPVLLQGIGRLPYRTDAYLVRTLEQLLQHWTPHFGFSTNVKLVARPFAQLLQADAAGELSQFVLAQLASQFLGVQRSQAAPHVGLILAMLQQLAVNLEQETQLLTLLQAIHVPLLDHLMFVGELEPSRVQVLTLYRHLVEHSLFQRSTVVRDRCAADLRALAEKHLAHCTYFYFQMLIKLAELAPMLVAPLFAFVRQQSIQVELKRGAGEDLGIRKCLQRLQQVLHTNGLSPTTN
ncbi:hypothetical protein ACLKA6_016306 [Drosophila palustris]